jgi:hypothetical protein
MYGRVFVGNHSESLNLQPLLRVIVLNTFKYTLRECLLLKFVVGENVKKVNIEMLRAVLAFYYG